jgi:glycosyltransferase involved in cell wall biosynthesis
VFAVSQPFCDLLEKKFPSINFTCLPNVIDPYLEKKPFSNRDNKQKDEFVFLNVAELRPKKSHKLLIDSFKKLKLQCPDKNLKLWIGGGGELYNELKEYIKQLDLTDDIKLLGPLNRDSVYEVMMKCDCFVLPSEFETFGVVLIEVMLTGKPIVTTASGGPESFVNEKTGIVVERNNVEALSNAMLQIIEKTGNFDPEFIRGYTIEEFGRERFVQRTNKIYHQLIQGR